MKLSPLKLGIIGALAYFASVAWVFLYFRIAARNDPPGWSVDRATPDAPKLVAMVGAGFVLVAVAWAIVRLVRRRAQ
jgi:heme A synthase